MKTRSQITAETRAQGQIPRSANYEYGKRVKEWDASLPNTSALTRDDFIRSVEPRNDRILVQLLGEPQAGEIVLTDHKPLIGGCRKARVLKTGPGKWIEGEWWKTWRHIHYDGVCYCEEGREDLRHEWEWFPGHRRPVSVAPGQTVLIGNWVDLEVEDVALCQEQDVRTIINGFEYDMKAALYG